MAHGSKKDLPVAAEMDAGVSRQAEWGEMTVAIENWSAGVDCTEMFKPLPDGRCQCPHWGYVVKGRVRIKYADREDVIAGGEAYYMEPGHIPVVEEDTELIEFSPLGEYQKTMAALEG
jgi:hypothetical protein